MSKSIIKVITAFVIFSIFQSFSSQNETGLYENLSSEILSEDVSSESAYIEFENPVCHPSNEKEISEDYIENNCG